MQREDPDWPGLPPENEPPPLTTFEFLTLTRQQQGQPVPAPTASPRFSAEDVLTVLKIAALILGWTGANLGAVARRVVAQLYGDSGS